MTDDFIANHSPYCPENKASVFRYFGRLSAAPEQAPYPTEGERLYDAQNGTPPPRKP